MPATTTTDSSGHDQAQTGQASRDGIGLLVQDHGDADGADGKDQPTKQCAHGQVGGHEGQVLGAEQLRDGAIELRDAVKAHGKDDHG